MTGTEREDRLALADLPKPETMLTYASILEKPQYVVKDNIRYPIATGEIIEAACAALRYCAALRSPVMEGMREALGQLKAGHWAVGSWFGGDFCENPKATKQVIEALYGPQWPSVAALSASHPQVREPQFPVGHYTGRPIT